MNNRARWIPIFILCASLFFQACTHAETRIGWMGSSISDHSRFQYQKFDGEEVTTLMLDRGQTLMIQYNLQIEEGSLALALIDSNDQVKWQQTHEKSCPDEAHIPIEDSGSYKLVIRGHETRGGFDVKWSVE